LPVISRDPLNLVGSIFERKYRVDRIVAEGGFGIVYQAHHLALDVPVALKLLRPSLSSERDDFLDLMSQFREEASVLSRLRRSNVVAVLDSGVAAHGEDPAGLPWMALEWLEGETLREDLARRRGQGGRTPAECMDLLRPVIEAIAEAHELKIAHRDLKPSNVMLVPVRGGVSPRVLDFGIAKMMAPDETEAPGGETPTDSTRPAFTALSAAPEQLSGSRTGPWTDVYGLGLLLTEVLTDRPPITAREPHERYHVAFAKERPTPGSMGVNVGSWEPILNRALAVRPADRQRDARALLDDLEAALATTTRGVTRSDPPKAPRSPSRRRTAFVVTLLGALIAAGAGAGRAWQVRGDAAVLSLGAQPLVIVSEFRAGGTGDDARTRRVAAAFAELLSEQLRIGDAMRVPAADARAAMLEASGLDPSAPAVTADLVSRLRSTACADVVVGGEITEDRGVLAARIELYDTARGAIVASTSLVRATGDVNALVREASARVRRSLGRPALSAEDETAVRASLPESAEASMVYVEGLAALRVFRAHDAAERFEEAHRLAPRFAPAVAALARARLKLGEDARAREAAAQAVELAPALSRGDELNLLALAAETRHDWPTAVDNYRALVRFYPDRVEYVTSLARALVGAGKAEDAGALLADAKKRQGSEWDRMRLDLVEAFAFSRRSQDGPAMASAREAEEYASRVGARVPLAEAVLHQAHVLHRAGRLDEAEALFTRARAVYVEVKDTGSALRCDAGMAEIARSRGDLARAIALGEKIVAAHREAGNLYRLARETVSLAFVHASAGHLAKARDLFDEGGRTYVQAHDREGEAYRLLNLAEIDLMLGRVDGVADRLRRGREIQVEVQHAAGVAEADGAIAHLAWREGRFADAEAAYETAYAEAVAASEASLLAEIALDRARLAFERKSPAEAARFRDASTAVAASSEMRFIALFDVFAAQRALARDDVAEARRLALSAESHARASHAPDALALALAALLDASADGRAARRAELIPMLDRLEAVEPAAVVALSLGRASSGDEAAAFSRRAYEMASSHGLSAVARAARQRLARAPRPSEGGGVPAGLVAKLP